MSSPSKSMYHTPIQQHPSSVPDSYMMPSNHVGEKTFGAPSHQVVYKVTNSNGGGVRGPPPPSSYGQQQQLHNYIPQQQPWRPMPPNSSNVSKIRYPPPPPPPSGGGYRGTPSYNRSIPPHNYQQMHNNPSPPSSSSNALLGGNVQQQQGGLYAHQSSIGGYSSSYGSHHHQPQQYNSSNLQQQHNKTGTNRQRIITNLNDPGSLSVNRRLDMSPESSPHRSGANNSSSLLGGGDSPTSRMNPGQQSTTGTPNKNTNRRRSSGTGQLAIKRSDQAPVTLKGWLYKQGSDGLMLWKKRWFVLSEFCLFYYKSSDEDKVSGSILLPSYKISPVIKEDGVVYHRKFSFKAEHHNMRTYFFAAETKESMIHWMNALSLASILQQHQELKMSPPVLLPPSSNPQQSQRNYNVLKKQQSAAVAATTTTTSNNSPAASNNNNSVKVIQHHPPAVYQMFNSNGSAYVPAGLTAQPNNNLRYNNNNNANNSNPLMTNGDMEGGPQPLYANAPPKPARRLNSSRDYSPDSDSENGMPSSYQHQPPQWPANGQQQYTSSHRLPHERRTPEAYARSQSHQIFQHRGDYEEPSSHSQRLPLPNYQQSQSNRLNGHNTPHLQESSTTPKTTFSPPKHRRPHSADFLEYDRSMHPRSTVDDQVITSSRRRGGGGSSQPPRPKSSIDQPRIFRNEEEFHLWTEESYAQKMREQQAFLHHQQTPPFQPHSRSQSRMSFARESNYNDSEAEVEKYFPTPMPRTPRNNSYHDVGHSNAQYQNLPLSAASGARSEVRLEAITPNRLSEMGIMEGDDPENGELVRSSSARLPRQRRNQSESDDPRRKEHHQDVTKLSFQREESMKRLLEWKQRMLQSPLTRKSSRNASRTQTPTNSSSPIPSFVFPQSSHDYIKEKVLEEFNKVESTTPSSRTPPNHSGEKRLSRKGSSGSRSSRSRSSPRFGSRRDLSSSDENEPPLMEARSSRRRKSSSSGQIRSRASSRDSKKSSTSSSNKRGSYNEMMAQVVEQQQIQSDTQQQPEYININSLEETLAKQRNGELSVVQRLNDKATSRRPPQYIGPDDWYKDDFDYDKFHSSFLQDPLLNRQYGMLLSDMKRSSEETDLEVQLVKRPSLGGQIGNKEEDDSLKYPDSAYETMTFRVNSNSSRGPENKEDSFKNSFSLEDINEALDDEFGESAVDKRKRSVKELLSDFEKKSKEVMLQETEALAEIDKSSRRRACSDTETMLYDTSSDEAMAPPLPSKATIEQEYLPMINKKQTDDFFGTVQPEDSHYVAMIPAPPPNPHQGPPPLRHKSYPLLPSCDHPEEPPSILHSRTPSQTLVMEHLQKEMNEIAPLPPSYLPPSPNFVEEDTYVDMNDDGTVNKEVERKKKRPILAPLESPRYCEIDEGQVMQRVPPKSSGAKTPSAEVLYHEIPEEEHKKNPLRPIEGLPDILGNNNNNNSECQSARRESLVSSSDQDSLRRRSSLAEDSTRRSTSSSVFSESTERRLSRSSVFSNDSIGERSRGSVSQLNVSDTFKPASFFLDHREKSMSLSKKSHQQYTIHHSSGSSSSLRDRELPKTPDQQQRGVYLQEEQHQRGAALPNSFPGFSFNLTYRSVYDTEGEATASTTEDDKESEQDDSKRLEASMSPQPSSKVPYYVSDIVQEERRGATLPSRRSRTENNLSVSRRRSESQNRREEEQQQQGEEDDEVFLQRSDGLRPARGVEPPPPPPGVPPLDVSRIASPPPNEGGGDDYYWRENLRKASAQVISSPPPTPLIGEGDSHHINGYLWDERSQRFYKLSNHPSSKTQEQLKNQTFLGESLPETFFTNEKGRQSMMKLEAGGRPSSRTALESAQQEEDQRLVHRRKSSGSSQRREAPTSVAKPPKIQDNIWELSSQDLLGKSHEELVLMLIHLRRQSAALNEAIEASNAELENIQANAAQDNQSYFLVEDLRNHIRDLEEQQARGRPIVSLVDNMVKLGTLYQGPEGAPLSHRLRNIPSTTLQDEEISRESSTTKQRRADIQELLQRSLEVVRQNINEDEELSKEDRESLAEEQRVLETELTRVTSELDTCQKKLDECSSDHARWEHDVLFLRQKLQASASRDMSYGLGQSAETLLVENELAQVQQRATELHKTRAVIQSKVDSLTKRPASSVIGRWTPGEEDQTTESSESFKRFLLQSKGGISESKTVRMVKRDSKERSFRAGDEGASSSISPPPPPPLPRGNYENLHDFLKSEQEQLSSGKQEQPTQSMPRTSSAITGLSGSNDSNKYLASSSTYKMLDMFKNQGKKDERPGSSLSAHERLFGSSRDNSMSPPVSPQTLGSKAGSSGGESLSSSFSANSPIFKSATAKAIIQEVGGGSNAHRRLKKRDKKRSYTITGGSSSSAVMEALNDHAARARDDMDMERVLRGSNRPNAPDVVKSTLDKKDAKLNPSSIDNLFGVPDKIVIPERYIPEADIDNFSREERQVRLKKADSIRRMLTENASTTDEPQNEEERKQRERILSLNQVLAREVMEKSRLVAGQSRNSRH